ncbi:monooxygenase [Xanthobacter aminoxidans]|uniref:monooxygenase n=1 Tax=Xanthobacter aminoxidans TaxID=186280 RepID=UPI002022D99C|nr:monooxygenase [Xanthobacter aminoxidans]MCL8385439.1 monooxygenase [Xanthobacter aminoxidans]
MLIAIVQIPGLQRSAEEATASARLSAPLYAGLDGLKRKYFLNGDAGGGGVYLWETREQAEAWYNEDWAKKVEARFGARPTVTYYENYVVVDNEADELRVNGASEPLPEPSPR